MKKERKQQLKKKNKGNYYGKENTKQSHHMKRTFDQSIELKMMYSVVTLEG